MKVLRSLEPEDTDTAFLIREFWEPLLFGWNFPSWLIDEAIKQHFNWTTIIRHLQGGQVAHWVRGVMTYLSTVDQKSMLKQLTVMAMTESEPTVEQEELRLMLLLDGFEVSDRKLVSVQGPISLTQERNRVLTNLASSSFARKRVIATHLKEAEDQFSSGKMHVSMGQSRSAFQAGVEDAVALVEMRVSRKAGSGLKNQVVFLREENFLSADEEAAFLAAWGFLSAGAHPGLPPDEVGRIGLIFGLEFIQVVMIKAKNLV